ncbi:2-amino-4-hydroxy-6-hydroxymethyldihydropteridine diphosphokinase [Lysobacter tyrosinilyticus]
MNTKTIALVGLGGNLGDAAATLRDAFKELDALPRTRLLRASKLYRSRAWGRTDQPDFINAVAMLETGLDARELLDAMLEIEHHAGRERHADERWGPRTLDLDLLLFGDAVIVEPGLHVPHPHLHERSFALVPLVEIAPDAMIPGIGSARAALAAMEPSDIEALG